MKTEHEEEFLENPEDIKPATKQTSAEEQEAILVEALEGKEWKGRKLYPFSFMRRRAAALIGLRLSSLTDEEREEMEEKQYYNGLDTDIPVVLYVCSLKPEEVGRIRHNPERAFEKAMEFAEKENLEPGTKEFTAAAEFFVAEFTALAKAKGNFEPAEKTKTKKDKKRPN